MTNTIHPHSFWHDRHRQSDEHYQWTNDRYHTASDSKYQALFPPGLKRALTPKTSHFSPYARPEMLLRGSCSSPFQHYYIPLAVMIMFDLFIHPCKYFLFLLLLQMKIFLIRLQQLIPCHLKVLSWHMNSFSVRNSIIVFCNDIYFSNSLCP